MTDSAPPPPGVTPALREPIPFLEQVRSTGRPWQELAEDYGVPNPEPPWRSSLLGLVDALSAEGEALPDLERRDAEDFLSSTLYKDVPQPERQLLALVHTMVARGLVDERDLMERVELVRQRLEAA